MSQFTASHVNALFHAFISSACTRVTSHLLMQSLCDKRISKSVAFELKEKLFNGELLQFFSPLSSVCLKKNFHSPQKLLESERRKAALSAVKAMRF